MKITEMITFGYKWLGMIPISKEMAKLCEGVTTVYALYPDGTEAEVDNLDNYLTEDVLFGIERPRKEFELIGRAIQKMQEIKMNMPAALEGDEYFMDGEKMAWVNVLNILGFDVGDISVAVEHGDLTNCF